MGAPHQVTVGVLADEGLPERVITTIADDLPDTFAARVSGRARWRVEHEVDRLPLDDDGDIPMRALSQEHRQDRGWDVLVLVTDLPRRAGTQPVVAGVDVEHGVAMISLPALGAVMVGRRTRALLVHVVRQLVSRQLGIAGDRDGGGVVARVREALAPTQRISGGPESPVTRLALVGLRGRLRLLAGMVRDNRPWRLVPHLAGATAAAAGTAAYGIITSSFWKLADALPPLRLAAITVVTVLVMTVWLTVRNHLWDRPSETAERRKMLLYNVSTATTLAIGVACMYAILFVLALLAAAVLIDSGYFEQTLGHPVGAGSYLKLVWLCSSVGIVAGALGSSLEDEETVRDATYGRRERERQERSRHRRERRRSTDSDSSTQNAPGHGYR
ncbi:hypothetical protein ABZ816_23545 [Actinosynnema sp. NPDC047251]|uniref:Uncharacterized protein n=1 Tax=Saccharothrix espanaensis (strain ATCC 51144 / DSM 44229 / JCM 9112 / NBRC 15066 / NRRL 15764) TaxID=1179773 RepID=K0K2L6_SACES|nr:hypothetical protein [Saccharothrix espanaensis]CCH32556.1 hypothetical protein BN6_52920 [Saccharothrix espanaensis DSM 44229]